MKYHSLTVILVCSTLFLSLVSGFLELSAYAQNEGSLTWFDTRIKGIVKNVQSDVVYSTRPGDIYELTALIVVQITEINEAPETFNRSVGDIVSVSYNYSSPPECRVNDEVAVVGLWVPDDPPFTQTIRVDDHVFRSHVVVMHRPLPIETEREYSNGSITMKDVNLWYTWINTEGTQVIFLAYHSPITISIGQHYRINDDTEVFIGNILAWMEAYEDSNRNGVPDADFITHTGEIKYFFFANRSVGFTPIPVQKTTVDGIPHYQWGVKYEDVDGFLFTTNGSITAILIDHLTFTYDYYIESNVTYLKTSFGIGKISLVDSNAPNATLNGLGLSVLYGTLTATANPYAVVVNGQLYNSTTTTILATPINQTEILIDNKKTYEFLFGQNYTLHKNSFLETYQSKSAASATNSTPPAIWALRALSEHMEDFLQDLFPSTSINLDYTVSTFLYRVCYPVWEGYEIEHDPTYVAYLNPQEGPPSPPLKAPSPPPLELVTAVALVGFVALMAAVLELRKLGKHSALPLAIR